MTQQAIVILMDWAINHTIDEQERFSVWLEKEIARHNELNMPITGRVVEAMIEEFESDN